jgi:hypothetical protein
MKNYQCKKCGILVKLQITQAMPVAHQVHRINGVSFNFFEGFFKIIFCQAVIRVPKMKLL